MDAALIAIAVGLAVSFVAFLARQLILPAMARAVRWARRPRDCRRLVDAARAELDFNIERLESASLASREIEEDGTERVFYRFGSAYSGMPVPELPTLRRSALDALDLFGRRCLGPVAGSLDDALAAIARYEALDLERFAEAWHGAMNPVIERMVIGDPGHQTNRANAKVVMDADKLLSRTREVLVALRADIDARASDRSPEEMSGDRRT